MADRVAVIRSGRIVAAGTVDELRGRARLHVDVSFGAEPPTAELAAVPGLEIELVDGPRLVAFFSGSIQPLLDVIARHPVVSLLIEEPDLEEAFLDLYDGAS